MSELEFTEERLNHITEISERSVEFSKELENYIYDHDEIDTQVIFMCLIKVAVDFAKDHEMSREYIETVINVICRSSFDTEYVEKLKSGFVKAMGKINSEEMSIH